MITALVRLKNAGATTVSLLDIIERENSKIRRKEVKEKA